MSEIGTGLQNATGIRNGDCPRGLCLRRGLRHAHRARPLRHAGRLAGLRRQLERSRSPTPTWPMAAATAAAASASGPPASRARSSAARTSRTTRALDYNTLNGGIERWFEPIKPEIGDGATMRTILEYCRSLFGRLAPETDALAHRGPPVPHRGAARRERQADARGHASRRRRLRAGAAGRPPQHRAAARPRSTTSTSARSGSFTLTDPLDSALVDDARCYHGVTPVEPENPAQPAYRDVLVVTFRKKPTA